MANTLMIVPADAKAELEKVSLALAKAFQTNGFKTGYLQPINQAEIDHVEYMLGKRSVNELLEKIVAMHEKVAQDVDVVIVKGLSYLATQPYVSVLNKNIADALNATIIILATANKKEQPNLENQIMLTARNYHRKNLLGYIIDKIDKPNICLSSGLKFITHTPNKKRPKISKKSIINFMTKQFDTNKIIANLKPTNQLSTALFRYQLIERAHRAYKKILLPEGTDVRIIKAAAICARREIAECIPMGNSEEILQIAKENDIEFNSKIKILQPDDELIDRYIEPMVALRKHKGMTPELAKESLQDNLVLATMMLQQDEVDGVVAGAVHSSAHTIRCALQIIKTAPNAKAVSSVFFICVPEQVMVFADCGVTLNPSAEELADIAIQTSETAVLFGIEPKIAMLSYSTYKSGYGKDVERVTEATKLIRSKRPDLIVDGPLQFDAAVNEEIANIKSPNTPVAGQATICIFPNLDSGNIGYKAVQRTANIGSFGPILQGLRKPVNDLSRGSTIEDIVFTIAITAVQADNIASISLFKQFF